MRNFRIVVQLLADLKLSKSPAMDFLGWRVQANNDRCFMLFIKIERNCRALFHIFEGGRVTLGEGAELPIILFENAAGH